MTIIPEMVKIKRHFECTRIDNIEAAIKSRFESSGIQIPRNSKIAVAVGSRGISNIALIVKTVVNYLKEAGAHPFIVPAMGSHGGATAQGQKEVLESYGISEQQIGVPIHSSMEVVELPADGLPCSVYMDRHAHDADGTVIINRIKAHTDFHGPIESGLMKMCVIGLGKHKQALEIHRFGAYGLRELIPLAAKQVLSHGNIIAGVAIVENAYEETEIIEVIKPPDIEQEEIKMLQYCKKKMPALPVDKIDVLIVDEIGKDISGTCLDTNVIGRMKMKFQEEPKTPCITHIVATDLTGVSHGNAIGVGLVDIITKKLHEKIDLKTTYENVITNTNLERGKIPLVCEDERTAVETALKTCEVLDITQAKIIRIKNTLRLDEIYVSEPVLKEIAGKEKVEVMGRYHCIIDKEGNFTEF